VVSFRVLSGEQFPSTAQEARQELQTWGLIFEKSYDESTITNSS